MTMEVILVGQPNSTHVELGQLSAVDISDVADLADLHAVGGITRVVPRFLPAGWDSQIEQMILFEQQ